MSVCAEEGRVGLTFLESGKFFSFLFLCVKTVYAVQFCMRRILLDFMFLQSLLTLGMT